MPTTDAAVSVDDVPIWSKGCPVRVLKPRCTTGVAGKVGEAAW
jgi:hypothetical protein